MNPAPLVALSMMLLPAPSAQRLERFWVLRCDLGPSVDPSTPRVRVFRIGPGVLQEWRAGSDRFGSTMCSTLTCKVSPQRLEGSVGSASLILTIRMDPATRQASWSTVGASGLKQVQGGCAVEADVPENRRGEEVLGTP
ncbi:MAG: hypothetical protein ABW042_00805 [Phenylobacterium sp.]